MLRAIDRFIDLSAVRRELASFYSHTGRPSIDPELMIRMLLVGYCFGIRSERRLCGEVHLNLAYRWFCRLGLDGRVPDHSTFSKNRHGRFRESDLFRRVFEMVVSRCIEEGFVGGEGFAVDGSLIKADANSQSGIEGATWSAPEKANRAVKEYVAALDDAAFGSATAVTPKHLTYRSGSSLDRRQGGRGLLCLYRQLYDRSRPRDHRRRRGDNRHSPGRSDSRQAYDRAHQRGARPLSGSAGR